MDWQRADLTVDAGGPDIFGDPSGYFAQDHARVVGLNAEGHIHELFWATGSKWADDDLIALSGGPISISSPYGYYALGYARVIYRGTDDHIHELNLSDQPGSAWGHADLTALTDGPAVTSDPFDYVALDHARILYSAADGHIHELALGPGSGASWTDNDLTAIAGAPTAANHPSGYVSYADKPTARVVYSGTDGHVHELYLTDGSGSVWGHADLTAVTNGPETMGRPFGYYAFDYARVIYRGTDDHIHELNLNSKPGSAWGHADLTALAGAPNAVGDPFGYPTGEYARIVHRDAAGQIHELSLSAEPGSGWGHADLTALAGGATAADGDPTAYLSYSGDRRARVVYHGIDDHIHELSLVVPEPPR